MRTQAARPWIRISPTGALCRECQTDPAEQEVTQVAGCPAGSPTASYPFCAPSEVSLGSESRNRVWKESLRFSLSLPLGGRRAEHQQRSKAVGGATSPPAAHPLHSNAKHRFFRCRQHHCKQLWRTISPC